ncbi:hypothetical protein BS78_K288000 [Paspalum vaginatum]|uniref:DUF4220 domain-containing protein n=1 Tax=Paspalum vaginatum TaxID=158149 RepID=A0A9W8CGH6_9POAL|nr:hypothetical protein BS78_K288000 [Paspalum vaginatum]
MMTLKDIHGILSSLFIMLNKKTLILFRIEFLVVLSTVLFLAMFIMDIFRRYHLHNSVMKAIFSIFDAVSDSIVTYLLGAMQTTPFKNQLFPVWGLVLVILRYSVGFISGYGVPDIGGRRFTEWRNVVKLLGSAFLNWTRGSRFARPLWSLWALQIVRSFYRFWCHIPASNSTWHGKSSEIISESMRAHHEEMEGHTYFVYGELVELQKPQYVLHIKESPSPVTLSMILDCSSELKDKDEINDLSLAFALSRLLRCRLEGVQLQRAIIHDINRSPVKKIIMDDSDDARHTSKIMETQLAFVNDYFNTRFPMVFWRGLGSLYISLLLSLVTIGVVLWLSLDIVKVYKPPEHELVHVVNGVNVDMIITWVFMFFVMFKEIWEMVIYLLSDWTRLLLVCAFAWQRSSPRHRDNPYVLKKLISSLFTSRITAKRWHGLLDQYVFVQSYDYITEQWNWMHNLTTGVVPKRDNGAKPGDSIHIPDCVRSQVLKKLRALLDLDLQEKRNSDGTVNKDGHCLPKVIKTLSDVRARRLYGWACFELHTSSQVILVWHIATSFCEMALAKEHNFALDNPGCVNWILSLFMFTSKQFLIDVDQKKKKKKKKKQKQKEKEKETEFMRYLRSCFADCCSSKSKEVKKKELPEQVVDLYVIANSLSRYCAYLLVSKPDLIPDSFLMPKMVFQTTVKIARDDILRHCDSLESRYTKLRLEAYIAKEDCENVKQGENVVRQGALLGKLLLDNEGVEGCWEILAGVWAELLVHLAPSWNAEAHKKCIESGGEFITNIWALLWHCGIDKSRLWPVDDADENNGCVADPRLDDDDDRYTLQETVPQAEAESKNQQIQNVVHEEETEIVVEAEEPESSKLRSSEPRGMDTIRS